MPAILPDMIEGYLYWLHSPLVLLWQACKHDFSHGISASIVMKAKGLTAACKDLETAFVLTSVTPRYPYYSGKKFMKLVKKQDIIT